MISEFFEVRSEAHLIWNSIDRRQWERTMLKVYFKYNEIS